MYRFCPLVFGERGQRLPNQLQNCGRIFATAVADDPRDRIAQIQVLDLLNQLVDGGIDTVRSERRISVSLLPFAQRRILLCLVHLPNVVLLV